MGKRSSLLWNIGQQLGERILDVPALREAHPEYAAVFRLGTIEGLEKLLAHLESSEILPPQAPRERKQYPRKAVLSVERMRELRSQGMSYAAIGQSAGITGEGVRLALK